MGSVLDLEEEAQEDVEPDFDMAGMVDDMTSELGAPYITLNTRDYAKMCAAIHFLGGNAIDVVGNAPYWLSFTPTPEVDTPAVEKPAAKAMQLIAWGDNGLNATDKQCYDLVLRMTKTQPGAEQDYVRVSLGAIATRLGSHRNTTSKAFWGLAELGLLDAVYRTDTATGHKLIYARAGKMPAWREVYAENKQRVADAKRKRVCEACASTKLRIETRCICVTCGTVQTEAPHYEELIDHLVDLENSQSHAQQIDIDLSTTSNSNTVLPEAEEPCTESVHGPLVQEMAVRKIYHIGPADMFTRKRPAGAFWSGEPLAVSPERLAAWTSDRSSQST